VLIHIQVYMMFIQDIAANVPTEQQGIAQLMQHSYGAECYL
jgi:hypothetical protein